MDNYGVYIHIPFCIRKCLYCDFNSGPGNEDIQKRYIAALLREIDADNELLGRNVDTVFIGGGTPSCVNPQYINDILCKLKEHCRGFMGCKNSTDDIGNAVFDAEVTIEVNPGTVNESGLHNYKKMGINRLSIGVQSFEDSELKLLGRIHNAALAEETFRMAREAGFDNINLDIMYGIPGQTLESFKRTLEKAVCLKPDHISCYSLIIEEGTPFYEKYGESGFDLRGDERLLPSEEELLAMDTYAHECLPNMGYIRYEISNYAMPGRECRHNRGYWQRHLYRGFGLGAASLIRIDRVSGIMESAGDMKFGSEGLARELRFTAEALMEDYLADSSKPLDDRKNAQEHRYLTLNEAMEEFMFLGFRECCGVSAEVFRRNFHRDIEEVFGETLCRYIEMGFIKKTEEDGIRYFFTEEGMNVSTRILADFLIE